MHSSSKPANFDMLKTLRQYKFQKKTGALMSQSSVDNAMTASAPAMHTMSESDESSNDGNPVKNSKIIIVSSESDGNNSESNSKFSINEASKDASSESENEAPPVKTYSRIRNMDSFKFKKKEETRGENTNSSFKRKANNDMKNGKSKRKKKSIDSDDEDMDGYNYKEDAVYDSDDYDSDREISNKMTESQNRVFEFLNNASNVELLQIPSCTQIKVNAIVEARPFQNWRDLVLKFKTVKNLATPLLNSALDVLKTRQIVSVLMKKCLQIAIKTEDCIARGATTIKEQPRILTEGLELKSYQMVGLNWLAVMHRQNLSGILADEMGLGKTIQVIAFLSYLQERGEVDGPHLIVAPSTTIENWAIEFTRWSPQLRVVIYHGSPEERRALRILWFKQKFQEMDVIITSYNIVSSSYEEKKMFKIVKLQYVVFDEAHMLKNMNTQRYFNLFNINAQHRILLTGTPLQNNLLELMSLLNFVMPDMFSRKIQYIKAFFSKNGKVPVESLPDFEQEQVELAKRIMKPFVLRRLKEDVLKDLPEKSSEVIPCPMTQEQKYKYSNLAKDLAALAQESPDDYNYMSCFMQLRKMANHPLALRYIYDYGKLKDIAGRLSREPSYKGNNEDHVLEDLSYLSDYEIHKLTKTYKCIKKFSLDDSPFLDSGKLKKLDFILPRLKEEGHRAIIFSQFVFVLDILEEYMRIRGHSCIRLDGSTRSLDRQELIDNYNEDDSIFIFLLTTRAGGVGINLTTADTVIIHDVDYNPYNDKQAEDRCHRLGQTKPVHVIRLVSEGTVEENIYEKAQNKLTLEQELTSGKSEEDVEETKNIEALLKQVLGLEK